MVMVNPHPRKAGTGGGRWGGDSSWTTMHIKTVVLAAVALLVLGQFLSPDRTTMNLRVLMFPLGDNILFGTATTTSANVQQQSSDYSSSTIRLVHVMNAYAIHSSSSNASSTSKEPFDQWAAMESIKRAMRYAPPQLHVDFVCAMFEDDRLALLPNTNLPCRTVLLERSTASEYPFLSTSDKPAKVLPFLQDILNAAAAVEVGGDRTTATTFGRHHTNNEDNNTYIMLTNSDIGVTKYFYQTIWPHLTTRREAFSMNRLTIPMENGIINETIMTVQGGAGGEQLLSLVDDLLEQGKMHPGYDCFVMHSSVLKRFQLGEMFAGHPPWGSVVHMMLRIMARNYTNIPSNVNGTFHLGEDTSRWMPKGGGAQQQQHQQFQEITSQRAKIDGCPIQLFGNHPYSILNTINCANWFQYDRLYNNHTIPNFVQNGYEDMYLQNYPNILQYTIPNGLGIPMSGSKAKAQKQQAAAAKDQVASTQKRSH